MNKKKRFLDTEVWKWIRTLLELAALAAVIIGIILLFRAVGISEGFAEGQDEYDNVTIGYVICVDYVNVRQFPNKNGEPLGMYEAGTKVYLDGKKKNGYLHIVGTGLEDSEGWIKSGYIVYDEPIRVNQSAVIVSKGRLAARNCVNGRRTRWLKPLASLKVYYWSDEWCVTNCGYVQTKYLELEGE